MSLFGVDRAKVVYPFVGSRRKRSFSNTKKKSKKEEEKPAIADNSGNDVHRWRIRDAA